METNVNEIANALEKTKQHASNFQTFLGINKWIREIENHEMELRSAQSDQSMANVDIQIRINPFLSKIERDVSEYGKLEINFSPPTKLVLRKEKQGQQLLIPSSPSISQIQHSTICSFDIPKGESKCMITGCNMFEDERMIFFDSRDVNKRIVVMNNKGSFIKEIKLTDIPFDVTVIDSNTAAVT
ncbi:unnamed protein product [Mytilus coruscus]|uniref:Uncharacterized protein n=1 Tax=Mytilus coruscus TaxID=42192 RepID=A0A6J8A0U2_MYTCO|nr:unnamed protein product [Mytilus coruscus]